MCATVKLAEYLFTRLRQLGVQSIHGVPGDYNLELLDYVEPNLHWVGNTNELNAGYAADGYSRIKGLGALVTTFGVGELSAINAIAGAYAELAPVVHIVGTPSRQLQDSRALIHHTLNDGDYRGFAQMHAHVTVAQASLRDPRTCPQLIDWTLQQCLIHSRPVYIEVPTDMVALPVAAEGLQHRIEIPQGVASNDEDVAQSSLLHRIYNSKRAMILVDGESRAFDIIEELHELCKLTLWPVWTTVFGKSLMDETLPDFRGIWKGAAAPKIDRDYVKSCDLILCFGPHFCATNSYQYSSIPSPAKTVLFTATTVKVADQTFRDLPMKAFLTSLLTKLDSEKIQAAPMLSETGVVTQSTSPSSLQHRYDDLISHDRFYDVLSGHLEAGDLILAETGTVGLGCRDLNLPTGAKLMNPSTWLSIGYMLPASQGAALAQREMHSVGEWDSCQSGRIPRTILLVGDGSFQVTAQELSTIIRKKLNVIVILINNDGYTIERCLHGRSQGYNDVASWDYLQAPRFFGATDSKQADYSAQTFQAKTWTDLESALQYEHESQRPALKMIEVMMDKLDAPASLLKSLEQQRES